MTRTERARVEFQLWNAIRRRRLILCEVRSRRSGGHGTGRFRHERETLEVNPEDLSRATERDFHPAVLSVLRKGSNFLGSDLVKLTKQFYVCFIIIVSKVSEF